MTIATQAFNFVRQRWPRAFHGGVPPGTRIDGAVEDVIIRIRYRPEGMVELRNFYGWFCGEIDRFFHIFPSARVYLVRFEWPAGVPVAKEICHRRRYTGAVTADAQERATWLQKTRADLAASRLPASGADWTRFFSDHALRNTLCVLLTRHLIDTYTPPEGRCVFVDHGRATDGTVEPCTAVMNGCTNDVLADLDTVTSPYFGNDTKIPGRRVIRLGADWQHPAGEAEFGILYAPMYKWPTRTIMVRSTDGDVVVAALLQCRSRVRQPTWRGRLLIDRVRSAGVVQVAGPGSKQTKHRRVQMVQEIVDVQTLCEEIERDHALFRTSSAPVETLCALLLMEGSDYTAKIRNVGFKTLIQAYDAAPAHVRNFLRIRASEAKTEVQVAPDAYLKLARDAYRLRYKKPGWSLQQMIHQRARTSSTMLQLHRNVANLAWTLEYMANAWRRGYPVPNELEVVRGSSRWGFEQRTLADGEEEPADWFRGIYPADRVYVATQDDLDTPPPEDWVGDDEEEPGNDVLTLPEALSGVGVDDGIDSDF